MNRLVLSTTQRLWAAAVLCVAPLGLLWSATPGFAGAGTTLSGACDGSGYCTPDLYVPGYVSPGTHLLVAQSPVRVFLVFAAVALGAIAATRRTGTTLRIARLAAVGAIAVTAVLAVANGVVLVAVCSLAALWLAGPPVVRPRHRARSV